MKSIISFFCMLMLVVVLMATTITSTPETTEDQTVPNEENLLIPINTKPSAGPTRRLLQYPHWSPYYGTCSQNPNVCRNPGSLGTDCCNNQCVNVKTDRSNCGKCGKRCRYTDICCEGKCVNPSNDKNHCGHCNNACKDNGGSCMYGMCSYA